MAGARAWPLLKAVFTQTNEQDLGNYAAAVAFFTMLSLFPALSAVVSLWGLVADPEVIREQLAPLARVLPAEVADLITGRIADLVSGPTMSIGLTGLISVGLAIWSGRVGVAAAIRAMNVIYGEDPRGGLGAQVAALVLTLTLMALALVALTMLVAVPIVLAVLRVGGTAAGVADVLRWVIAGATVVLALGLLYRYGPNRHDARVRWVSPGALVATAAWALATVAFGIYLRNFGNYNELYGSIGAVIVMMLWLYISAFVALLGAALDAQLELRQRQDTTTGPDRPMGERGAHVADTFVPPGR
jgi:membrane protein